MGVCGGGGGEERWRERRGSRGKHTHTPTFFSYHSWFPIWLKVCSDKLKQDILKTDSLLNIWCRAGSDHKRRLIFSISVTYMKGRYCEAESKNFSYFFSWLQEKAEVKSRLCKSVTCVKLHTHFRRRLKYLKSISVSYSSLLSILIIPSYYYFLLVLNYCHHCYGTGTDTQSLSSWSVTCWAVLGFIYIWDCYSPLFTPGKS